MVARCFDPGSFRDFDPACSQESETTYLLEERRKTARAHRTGLKGCALAPTSNKQINQQHHDGADHTINARYGVECSTISFVYSLREVAVHLPKGRTDCRDRVTRGERAMAARNEAGTSPPPDVHFGSASPPPSGSGFTGRGGTWQCEQCSTTKQLPPDTMHWICPHCHTKNYTLPPDECPLDTFCPCCCWDSILVSRN